MGILRSAANLIRTTGAVAADCATFGMFVVTGEMLTERSLKRQRQEEVDAQYERAARILIEALKAANK